MQLNIGKNIFLFFVFFTGCSFYAEKIKPFFYRKNQSLFLQNKQNLKPVVTIKKQKGSVLFKHVHQWQWFPIEEKDFLDIGDMVFVGEKSYLKILYNEDNTEITLPSETIFLIEANPPIQTKANKTMYKPFEDKKKPEDDAEVIDKDSARKLKEDNQVKNMRIKRKKFPLPIAYPKGILEISASKYPIYFSVALHPSFQNNRKWLYLWNSDGQLKWYGPSKDDFSQVPILESGEYTAQVFTDDERFISQPIFISVAERERIDLKVDSGDLTRVFYP